ncbi:hypothetical protein [Embleya sp. NPDC001921]
MPRHTVHLSVAVTFDGDYYEARELVGMCDDWISAGFNDRDDLVGHTLTGIVEQADTAGAPAGFEFRLSPDRSQIAIWEPGNEPWFIPERNMPGRFVGSAEMNGLGWTRYLPAAEPAADPS